MEYDFDRIVERRGTGSFKWDTNQERFGRDDLIPFWVADMDFASPQPVTEAMKRRLEHPVYGYSARDDDYFSAVTGWLSSRHNWQVKREWLAFSPPGVIQAIHILINILTRPGDSVVVQTPAYSPLLNVVTGNGRVLVKNSLKESGGRYMIDFDDLEEKIDSAVSPSLLLFCSPHNPSGRVWDREELVRLSAICSKRDIFVISDEIHADFVFPGKSHLPYGSLSDEALQKSITCISASKTFNISGLQLATLVIADAEIRERYEKAVDVAQLNLDNIFGEVALKAAYTECEEWLDHLLVYLKGNLDMLTAFISEHLPAVKVNRPEGTYLVWLDFRALGLSSAEINRLLVERAGVALYEGREFGEDRDGFFRMNIACPRPLLKEGLTRIGEALSGYL